MIRKCQYCGKYLGEKEPFEDKSETHGVCDPCFEKEIKKIDDMTKKENKK